MEISVVPFCGLGNRLNVISSAIALKQVTGHAITIYWQSASDCCCRWDDLFQPVPGLPILPLDKFYLLRRGKCYLRLPMLIRLFHFDACFKARKILDSDFLLASDLPYKHIYIEGNKRFCPLEETEMLSRFYRPSPELAERIEAVTSHYSTYTVGVHIRRTDHKAVIRDNPLEAFIQTMHGLLQEHPETVFYIASDDSAIMTLMEREFPRCIIGRPPYDLRRNSLQGMKDAVVELFCLARTHLIIGSRGSTYSELAAKLYNTPIIYVN